MIKATIKLMLDNKPLSNGKHAIYLRILKDRKRKNISLGLQCKKEHFINDELTKKHPNYQLENEMLLKLKSRALEIIRNYQLTQSDFSLKEFEQEFRGIKKNVEINAIDFFKEIIDELTRSGKIGNAQAYKGTMNSLIKFKNEAIKFKDITPTFLEKYEVYLRENNNKNGGIKFKMRHLKALYNKARKRNIIPKEPYPFEEYKFSRLKSESRKIALTLEEYKKIKNFDFSKHPTLIEAHNYFMFSVYARGMNFKDMMHLKWSNIQNDRIYYIRSKTKGKLNLEIIPPLEEILNYYKNQNRDTEYVFPILLKDDLTPTQIYNRRHKVIRRYNRKLKEIAKLAGLKKKPTSYVARHTFATVLKMTGTPIEKITEMMAHGDVSVTIAYLKEFSNEDLDKESRKFINL